MLPFARGLQQGAPGVKQPHGVDIAPRFADPSTMSENDDEALRARADTLARALKSAQSSRPRHAAPPPAKAAATGAALSLAVRASSEMVAGVVVGGVIGWGDRPAFSHQACFPHPVFGVWMRRRDRQRDPHDVAEKRNLRGELPLAAREPVV